MSDIQAEAAPEGTSWRRSIVSRSSAGSLVVPRLNRGPSIFFTGGIVSADSSTRLSSQAETESQGITQEAAKQPDKKMGGLSAGFPEYVKQTISRELAIRGANDGP